MNEQEPIPLGTNNHNQLQTVLSKYSDKRGCIPAKHLISFLDDFYETTGVHLVLPDDRSDILNTVSKFKDDEKVPLTLLSRYVTARRLSPPPSPPPRTCFIPDYS